MLCIEFQPIFNGLRVSYPTSPTTSLLFACEQVATGLMLLVIWWYAAAGHRLIDATMSSYEIRFFALRALLIPIIFMLSIAVILFRNDLAIYVWLLVIVAEGSDLVYRRMRRRTHEDYHLLAEGDL
jgi:hypothetical protein